MPSSQPDQLLSLSADKNLERIKLPTFSGDKTDFEYLWTTFECIVDDSDEHAKYKMMRLNSYLHEKRGETISRLIFSDEACEEAKTLPKEGLEAKEDDFKIT